MSKEEMLEKVIEYLTERHLDTEGGYPYDYERFRGHVFIAALDGDNETALLSYRESDLIRAYKRAEALCRKEPEDYETLQDALGEVI